jgi:hypothetical protein
MSFFHYLRSLREQVLSKSGSRHRASRSSPGRRLEIEELENRTLLSTSLPSIPNWMEQGPGPILSNVNVVNLGQNNAVSGAVEAIAAHPTNPNIVYVGTVNGGVWRTTNATALLPGLVNWTPLTDEFQSLSISTIAFSPLNTNTVFAGTGRLSAQDQRGGPAIGLLRTTDGGNTWANVGNMAGTTGFADERVVGLVPTSVNTETGQVIVVGTMDGGGVYSSRDGGNTWTLLSGTEGLPVGDVSSMTVDVGSPNRIFVAIAGELRFDNFDRRIATLNGLTAGDPIRIRTNAPHGFQPGDFVDIVGVVGNTQANGSRFRIRAVNETEFTLDGTAWNGANGNGGTATPANVNTGEAGIYEGTIASNGNITWVRRDAGIGQADLDDAGRIEVSVGAAAGNPMVAALIGPDGDDRVQEVYRFTNAIPNWRPIQNREDLNPGTSIQGSIHFSLLADNANPNVFYIAGVTTATFPFASVVYRVVANDVNWANDTWTAISANLAGNQANNTSPHADSRDMVFDANGNILEADDGGIVRLNNPTIAGRTWVNLTGNLRNTEVLSVGYDTANNTLVSGGQDTGSFEQEAAGSQAFVGGYLSGDGNHYQAVDTTSTANNVFRYSAANNLLFLKRRVFGNPGGHLVRNGAVARLDGAAIGSQIRITTVLPHGLAPGDIVQVTNLANQANGETLPNIAGAVTILNQMQFTLDGIRNTWNGIEGNSGIWERREAITTLDGAPGPVPGAPRPIRITTPVAHNLVNGATVRIWDVNGNGQVNGNSFQVRVLNQTQFTINNTNWNGATGNGGTWLRDENVFFRKAISPAITTLNGGPPPIPGAPMPIRITTPVDHNLINGAFVLIQGVTGNTQANGQPFVVTVLNATQFTLNNTVWNGVAGAGGTYLANGNGLNTPDQALGTEFPPTPYVLNQVDPRRMMAGYNGLYEDNNPNATSGLAGDVIQDITALLPGYNGQVRAIVYGGRRDGVQRPNVAIVGTTSGQLFYRNEGGALLFIPVATGGMGAIDDIAVDSNDWRRVYVVQGNHVFMTTDIRGAVFTDITGDLTGGNGLTTAINSITLLDYTTVPGDEIPLVGGLGGVFRLLNGTWREFGAGLPNAIVTDVLHDATDDLLVAGTLGRGIWTISNVAMFINAAGVLEITEDEFSVDRNDTIRLVRNAGNPLLLDVFDNNDTSQPTFSVPISILSKIRIDTKGGNDKIILDYSNGFIRLPDRIEVVGGTGTDMLQIDEGDNCQRVGGALICPGQSYVIGSSAFDPPYFIGRSGLSAASYSGVETVIINADNGKDTFDVAFRYGAVPQVNLVLNTGHPSIEAALAGTDTDTVWIRQTHGSVTVNGASGIDTVTVGDSGTLQTIRHDLSISNDFGFTDLILDGSGDTVSYSNVTLTENNLTGVLASGATIAFDPGHLSHLQINSGEADDEFTIQGTPKRTGIALLTTEINTGNGHNVINIQRVTPSSKLSVTGGDGDDTFNLGEEGHVSHILGSLVISGGEEVLGDSLNVNDQAILTVERAYTVTSDQVRIQPNPDVLPAEPAIVIAYDTIENLELNTGSYNASPGGPFDLLKGSKINVEAANLAVNLSLNGGLFGDSLVVTDVAAHATLSPLELSTNLPQGRLLKANGMEEITVHNTSLATTATLLDSTGSDTFLGRPFFGQMSGTVGGSGVYSNTVHGYADIIGRATPDPYTTDTAHLEDPTGLATFLIGEDFVRMFRPEGFSVTALNFDDVTRTMIVTNTNDRGLGSLRAALTAANNSPGPDTIRFNIPDSDPGYVDIDSRRGGDPGPDVFVIRPSSPLPALTDLSGGTTIDGRSQTTFSNNPNPFGPEIVLDGSLAGPDAHGLEIRSSGNQVLGLTIHRFSGSGVVISAGSGNLLAGNFLGTDATGTVAVGNLGNGIEIIDSANNTIGGTTAIERNIISGNDASGVLITGGGSTGNTIAGNYVGPDVTGNIDLGNDRNGVVIQSGASSNTVGGSVAGAGNVISGNTAHGVYVLNLGGLTHFTQIQGNIIGLNAAGDTAMPNVMGILVGASNTTIGGTTAQTRNVISGNTFDGINLQGFVRGPTEVVVQGNYIGTNLFGTAPVPNTRNGITIRDDSYFNTIGGTTPGAGNVISGNGGDGIQLFIASGVTGPANNLIQCNTIGLNATGSAAIGNAVHGVSLVSAGSNTIGGTTEAACNVISGNGSNGVYITGAGADHNMVVGNYIGTDANGSQITDLDGNPLGNTSHGVLIRGGAKSNYIGTNGDGEADFDEGNLISGNKSGVVLTDPGTSDNRVAGNLIGTDVEGRVALGNADAGVSVSGGALDNFIGTNGDGVGDAAEGNVISGHGFAGISIGPAGGVPAGRGNVVAGNLIGLDANGTFALGNIKGVQVQGVLDTRIGTNADGISDDLEGNIISASTNFGVHLVGGAQDTVVAGNYIGTDINGTNITDPNGNPLGNATDGVWIAGSPGNTIGGPTEAARNVIAGNGINGVYITGTGASDNVVQGNYVGLAADGVTPRGNGFNGVRIDNAPNNTVGGLAPIPGTGSGNVISGNTTSQGGVGILGVNAVDNQVLGNIIGLDKNGDLMGTRQSSGVGLAAGASGNMIGGAAVGSRNIISGNQIGVALNGAHQNTIAGNFIGTDVTGMQDHGNSVTGILFDVGASRNRIGGATPAERNVIAGNDLYGLFIKASSSGNVVQGNFIGVDQTGVNALANAIDGVRLVGAQNTVIGSNGDGESDTTEGNLIAFHPGAGVAIYQDEAQGNSIRGNSIHSNGGLGINLVGGVEDAFGVTANDPLDGDRGPNLLQNYPVLASARTTKDTRVAGKLASTRFTTFLIDFYANTQADPSGFGEGQRWLGSTQVTTNDLGEAGFSAVVAPAELGEFVTATATRLVDDDGDPATPLLARDTSEFSQAVEVRGKPDRGRGASGHFATASFGSPLTEPAGQPKRVASADSVAPLPAQPVRDGSAFAGEAEGNHLRHSERLAVQAHSARTNGITQPLTVGQVEPMFEEDLNPLQASGATVPSPSKRHPVPADWLGMTFGNTTGPTISFDVKADNRGWFVNPDPWEDSECTPPGEPGQQNRIDLLMMLMQDPDNDGLMQQSLAPGTRHNLASRGGVLDLQSLAVSPWSFNRPALDWISVLLATESARER